MLCCVRKYYVCDYTDIVSWCGLILHLSNILKNVIFYYWKAGWWPSVSDFGVLHGHGHFSLFTRQPVASQTEKD